MSKGIIYITRTEQDHPNYYKVGRTSLSSANERTRHDQTYISGGIKTIREFFGKLIDWKKLDDLIPKNFKNGSKYKRTGKAGIFAGSLELVKEGNLTMKQDKLFDDIYVKENND